MDTKIYIDAIEKELALCCDEYFYKKSSVADAARYSLLNAGKRIRAILLFMTAEMCGKDWRKYLRLASAVEMMANPALLAQAQEEFRQRVGKGYEAPIPKEVSPKPMDSFKK